MATTTAINPACPTKDGAVGPMTTPFTAPPDCAFPLTDNVFSQASNSCAPPFWSAYVNCKPPFRLYYSPAVCPYGYTTGSTGLGRYDSFTLSPGESVATCCPPYVKFLSSNSLFALMFKN
jgi:hypothetical protein